MRPFAIAGLQIELVPGGKNLGLLLAHIQHVAAVFPWVQMVILSELCVNGAATARAEPMPGPTERALQGAAQKQGLWLVTGSAHERVGDLIYNTASVIDPSGRVILRYRKMFPFRPYAVGVTAGTDFAVFDVPGVGRFGLSICYDIWVPETSRTLACMGAEVLIHPTMTPTIDRDVELSIARSTAATNQMYVLDINGARGGGVGRSIIVGPDGDVMHQAGSGTEHIVLELDLDRVTRSRERGLLGLGQQLKTFRDSPVGFDVYTPGSPLRAGLDSLGPLTIPGRAAPREELK
ncbi:MAG: putative amidohydrolase [Myxococcota bacterium]|jgi:predicted amidohydrolase